MPFILKVILFLIIINNAVCKIYCIIEKRRSTRKKKLELQLKREIDLVEKAKKRESFIKKELRRIYFIIESLFRLNMQLVSIIPSHFLRRLWYVDICGAELHKTSVIYYGAEIRAPWNLKIGEGSIIGDKSILDAREGIKIGKNVNFSTGVCIWTLQHDMNDKNFGVDGQGAPVVIDDRAWISCRTIILPGVHIEEGAVVAAGAVVTKDCDAFSIYGGVPAKLIGKRSSELMYEFVGKHYWFL